MDRPRHPVPRLPLFLLPHEVLGGIRYRHIANSETGRAEAYSSGSPKNSDERRGPLVDETFIGGFMSGYLATGWLNTRVGYGLYFTTSRLFGVNPGAWSIGRTRVVRTVSETYAAGALFIGWLSQQTPYEQRDRDDNAQDDQDPEEHTQRATWYAVESDAGAERMHAKTLNRGPRQTNKRPSLSTFFGCLGSPWRS